MADEATPLPTHPTTGLRALGMTSRGPIWPAIGGNGEGDGNTGDAISGTDTTATTAEATPEPQGTGPVAPDDLEAWKAAARKHEDRAKKASDEAKANAAAAKELADLKAAQMNDSEKAAAATKAANERAEAAERRAAIREAIIDHGLTKDDIEFLEDVPADRIADRAKKLAARNKAASAGASGTPVGGAQHDRKPATLGGALAAHYSR